MPLPARDSVFISYSHRDAAWLDNVLIFLKPFLREGTLSIWNDTYIQAGDLWRREIDVGLQRASVGLLLVSPHFMASDFIINQELPALVNAAKRNFLKLVWVPVSASHWEECPLKHYQAAWSPDRPLDRLRTSARNKALVQITKEVVEAAKKYGTAASTELAVPRRQERTGPTIYTLRESIVLGDLHNIPDLPPHYVPRADDLARLRRSLLEHRSSAVGITGESYRMGLHGQGGIGKSVLAAALARDEQVRLAFPDGVFWVTVGQKPDVRGLQATLLAEAGFTAEMDEQRNLNPLEQPFAHSAVLLVLDDVWDYRHARAFDKLGPASRLLVTTRDGAVLTALGAHSETVQRLPKAAALDLLWSWAGRAGDSLPKTVHEVAHECGYLPLALSLAGARVHDGLAWDVLLKALKRGRLEFLDHPYGSVFGSMRLSVDALPPDERQRYLELAVFPEDERVPVTVVLTLWKKTAGLDELDGEALLSRLRSKALLEILDADGRREVALHDLQHDFLRLSVRDRPSLHGRLLEGWAAEFPVTNGDVPWWNLPLDEPYAWDHLAGHLVAAGRGKELRGLLFDCRWLEEKLRASGLPAVLADFAALPRDKDLSLVAGALRLSGHVLNSDAGQLRSQLTGRLLGTDRPRIVDLLQGAVTVGGKPWLRPNVPLPTPPTGSLLRTLVGYTDWLMAVAVSSGGQCAVSGSANGTVKVWNMETSTIERTLVGHTRGARAVAVTADGRRAVSGSADGTIIVWDLETSAKKCTLVGHAGRVMTVAITADGRCAVSGSDDRTIKVWDLETGEEKHTLTGHADWVMAVAVTVDGRRAVSGSDDKTVKVWDLETGKEERTLAGHAGRVAAVAVTADGRCAVSGSYDRTMKVWDLETGKEKRTLAGAAGLIRAMAATPDGRRAVSSSDNQTVTVWELGSGDIVANFTADAFIDCCAVTSDGMRLLAGDRLNKMHFLTLEGLPPE